MEKLDLMPEWVSQRSGAALLEMSPTTFWRRVKDGTLPPPAYIGTMPRWHRATLLGAVAAATRQP